MNRKKVPAERDIKERESRKMFDVVLRIRRNRVNLLPCLTPRPDLTFSGVHSAGNIQTKFLDSVSLPTTNLRGLKMVMGALLSPLIV